ncbi:MAG: hypothetical protein H6Q00_1446 [Holophagaceae bacterium]|nr:hypothetical protein [Holophagaceae bacterium]
MTKRIRFLLPFSTRTLMAALGMSLNLSQPLYAGGRIQDAGQAGGAMARSETSLQAHRHQQVARHRASFLRPMTRR